MELTPGVVQIIAHRGFSSRAPENTLAAIELALTAGARAVEWDIHVAACGTAMVFHDTDLERTTDGSGRLDEHTLTQLKKLDAGSWFSPQFSEERIPTLSEAFAAVRGHVDRVYPEIKGYGEPAELVQMVTVAHDTKMIGATTFISMDYKALEVIRAEDSEVDLGYIVEDEARLTTALELAAADPHSVLDLDFRIALTHPEFLSKASEEGIPIVVWTVDDPIQADRVMQLGVSGITTNQVETLLDWSGLGTT